VKRGNVVITVTFEDVDLNSLLDTGDDESLSTDSSASEHAYSFVEQWLANTACPQWNSGELSVEVKNVYTASRLFNVEVNVPFTGVIEITGVPEDDPQSIKAKIVEYFTNSMSEALRGDNFRESLPNSVEVVEHSSPLHDVSPNMTIDMSNMSD
jgi:hypothetical protein